MVIVVAGFESDLQIVERMVSEQSVFPLPGMCFNIKNFFRIVLTVPRINMVEACARIAEFCNTHYVQPTSNNKHLRTITESSDVSDMTLSSNSSSAVASVVNSSDEMEEEDEALFSPKIKEITAAAAKIKV